MDLLLPSTFGADERDMKNRVVKYGIAARTAAIFGYDRIIIYKDTDPKIDQQRSAELFRKYLEYAECPPYLRKELIPKDEDLQYANIMPALQVRSHGYEDSIREAAIVEAEDGELTIEAGLSDTVTAYGDHEAGERVTVRVIDRDTAEIIDRDEIDGYWTFDIEERNQKLGEVLESDDVTGPVIGTSAHGEDVRDHEDELRGLDDHVLVFGSAWRGIPSLAERGDLDLDQVDHLIDFVPNQRTKTVRTEEALGVCAGILNLRPD